MTDKQIKREQMREDHQVTNTPQDHCKHTKAFFCMSHTDNLGWCPDCNTEVTERDL